MSTFKELSQEEIQALLEGHQDVLSAAMKKEEALFRHSPCPTCGSYGHEAFVNPRQPFIQGELLPNKILRCFKCQTEFDPHSGFVFKVLPPDETDPFPSR